MAAPTFSIRPGVALTVAAGASSAATSTAVKCTQVMISATVDSYVQFGASPTASATASMYVPASVVLFFQCQPTDKVAALRVGGTSGTVFITPGT